MFPTSTVLLLFYFCASTLTIKIETILNELITSFEIKTLKLSYFAKDDELYNYITVPQVISNLDIFPYNGSFIHIIHTSNYSQLM